MNCEFILLTKRRVRFSQRRSRLTCTSSALPRGSHHCARMAYSSVCMASAATQRAELSAGSQWAPTSPQSTS